MKTGTTTDYSIIKENTNGITMQVNASVNERSIIAIVSIRGRVIQICGIDNCKHILHDFFKIFEGNGNIGLFSMDEIIADIDFTSMALDYKRGEIVLLFFWASARIVYKFNNEYKRRKWEIGVRKRTFKHKLLQGGHL